MNLVAKEFVASKNNRPGVLILSEMAGAAREMGEALIVNPNNLDEMADAIKTALQMSPEEQTDRLKVMQNRLIRYDVKRWASDFLMKLKQAGNQRIQIQAEKLSFSQRNELLSKVAKSRQTLLLLDYDGTIVPIRDHPEKATPDNEILTILQKLQDAKEYTVAIVSGRDKEFMEKYFGHLNLTLCAEHGVWIKEPREKWNTINFIQNTWKDKLKPILELYADRTPGAILEVKDYSLAFHFRNADPELATIRVRELTDSLIHQVSNLNLCVMEGKKVIEIKNAGINKGDFALKQIEKGDYDLVIAIGDDVTDEDLFDSLPEDAVSIKVGIGSSKAKYFLDSVYQVRELLKQLSVLHTSDQPVERTG
jgi:trehalose 6-phosphate synthase/phosphatase